MSSKLNRSLCIRLNLTARNSAINHCSVARYVIIDVSMQTSSISNSIGTVQIPLHLQSMRGGNDRLLAHHRGGRRCRNPQTRGHVSWQEEENSQQRVHTWIWKSLISSKDDAICWSGWSIGSNATVCIVSWKGFLPDVN